VAAGDVLNARVSDGRFDVTVFDAAAKESNK
jgi:hypothetical protein